MNKKMLAVLEALKSNKVVKNQGELAQKLGYNKSHFSQVMNGAEPVSSTLKEKLYTLFGISQSFWMDDDTALTLAEPDTNYNTLSIQEKYNKCLDDKSVLLDKLTAAQQTINELNQKIFELQRGK